MKDEEMELETKQRESGPEGELESTRRPFWRRHRWLIWTLAGAGGALLAISVALGIVARQFEPYLKARIVAGLQERFQTRVELDQFHVAVHHGEEARWGIWATGRGLKIWPPQQTGGGHRLETAVQSGPLIQLDEFTFHVPLLLERIKNGQPLHIAEVRLTGLTIHVPPKSEGEKAAGLNAAMKAGTNEGQQNGGTGVLHVVVDRVVCNRTELVLETSKPGKLPLDFDLVHLKVTHLKAGEAVDFEADLINPKPSGAVHTTGNFGPWNTSDPGASAVSGRYTFAHANLGEFKGIGGTLSSNGSYRGELRDIAVMGEAVVPDFSLSHFGTALPLHTNFRAHVDGTDGDTYLDEVDAELGRSQFTTSGKVVRVTPGEGSAPGHEISLKVDVPGGQIDDFIRLLSKSDTPLMSGTVESVATLHISPGKEPVPLRIKLDGEFTVNNARFTSQKVQERIEDLSLRGQGKPQDLKHADPNSITSQMQGSFHMANGVIALPDLRYTVPGADIELKGTYALSGELHFDGTARMQATISQMVGGWKGFLLRPADRFFKKDGAGTLVPIKIRGTREAPDYSIDFGQLGHTAPARPGGKMP